MSRSASGQRRPTTGGSNKKVGARPSSRGVIKQQNNDNKIGPYIIGSTIGEGTFGKVKLAIHRPTGEKVAIKILEKKLIKEQADIRRVNREIKMLKKSKHSNVIQLYEVLDTNSAIYLVMENCNGGEMFDYIVSHKHVQEKQACIFFHQILDGLESIHNNDVTHRDLKPENLLLKYTSQGWVVKIVDFGLSNTHENGRLLSTACGSPCYAAPEMIKGLDYRGPVADLWSCGVILFALVCGHLPFEDQNTAKLYEKILSGVHKPSAWCSTEVRDLLRHILEVNPDRRFTIADIRKHPWYCSVQPHQIPIDNLNKIQQETTHKEIMEALSSAGLNMQQIEDGLASKLCNSATATYYLMEQKAKNYYQEKSELNAQMVSMGIQDQFPSSQEGAGAKASKNVKTAGSVKEPVAVVPQSKELHINTCINPNSRVGIGTTANTTTTITTTNNNNNSNTVNTSTTTNTAYRNKIPVVPKLDLKATKQDQRKQDIHKKNVVTVTQSARKPQPPRSKPETNHSRNGNGGKNRARGTVAEDMSTSGAQSARSVMISNPPTTVTVEVAKVIVEDDTDAEAVPAMPTIETGGGTKDDVVQPLGAGTPGIQTPEDRPSTRRSRQRTSRGPSRSGTSHSRVSGDDGLSGLTGIHPPDGVSIYGTYGTDRADAGVEGVDGPGMGNIPLVPRSVGDCSDIVEDTGNKIEITITNEAGGDDMENYTTELIGHMISPVIALKPKLSPEIISEASPEDSSVSTGPTSGRRHSPAGVTVSLQDTSISPTAVTTNIQPVPTLVVPGQTPQAASTSTSSHVHNSAYTKAPVIPNMAPRSNHSSNGGRKGKNIVLVPLHSPVPNISNISANSNLNPNPNPNSNLSPNPNLTGRMEKIDKEMNKQRRVVALNASPYIRENKLNSMHSHANNNSNNSNNNNITTATTTNNNIAHGQTQNQTQLQTQAQALPQLLV